MRSVLLVGLGGFVGSVSRYLVVLAAPGRLAGVPLATLLVNVVGSFLAGVLFAVGESRLGSDTWRFAMIGCLGGFTTYSAFSAETLGLFRAGDVASAALTVGAHVALGLAAVWAGFALVR